MNHFILAQSSRRGAISIIKCAGKERELTGTSGGGDANDCKDPQRGANPITIYAGKKNELRGVSAFEVMNKVAQGWIGGRQP